MIRSLAHNLKSKRIVLASASPRRKEILENMGLEFTVVASKADENLDVNEYESITAYVEALAKLKADSTIAILGENHNYDIIIAADTIVCLDKQIFGKPSTQSDAVSILTQLSGKTHEVITGVCIVWCCAGKPYQIDLFNEITEVTMAILESDVIEAYVESGEPMDKAGAYGIQGIGCSLIKKINGDYFNVVGLPAHKLSQYIRANCKET